MAGNFIDDLFDKVDRGLDELDKATANKGHWFVDPVTEDGEDYFQIRNRKSGKYLQTSDDMLAAKVCDLLNSEGEKKP